MRSVSLFPQLMRDAGSQSIAVPVVTPKGQLNLILSADLFECPEAIGGLMLEPIRSQIRHGFLDGHSGLVRAGHYECRCASDRSNAYEAITVEFSQ